MARFETLVCDKCGKEKVVPVYGWISTKAAKGSTTEASPTASADFCSPNCLVQYFGAVAIQQQLEDATEGASLRLVDGEGDDDGKKK